MVRLTTHIGCEGLTSCTYTVSVKSYVLTCTYNVSVNTHRLTCECEYALTDTI